MLEQGFPTMGRILPKGESRFQGWGIGTTVWHIDTVGVLISRFNRCNPVIVYPGRNISTVLTLNPVAYSAQKR